MTIRGTDKPKLYVTDIPKILESPEVRNLAKDTIRAAMTKDPFDAVTDLQLALAAVEAWADDILNKNTERLAIATHDFDEHDICRLCDAGDPLGVIQPGDEPCPGRMDESRT